MQGPHKVCMDGPCLCFALTTATSPSFSADASPGNDNQIPFIQTQTIKMLYSTLMQQRSEPGPKEGRGGIGDSALTLCTNPVPIVQNNPVPIVQNNPIPIVQSNPSIPERVEAPVATLQLLTLPTAHHYHTHVASGAGHDPSGMPRLALSHTPKV